MKSIKIFALATALFLNHQNMDANPEALQGLNTALSSSGNEPQCALVPTIRIYVEVSFGKKKADCDKKGLCDIKAGVEIINSIVRPFMTYDDATGTIVLEVPKAYIQETQPEKLQYFAGQTEYELDEDFAISQELSKKLGADHQLVIRAGKYRLIPTGETYKLIIGEWL